MRKFCCLSELLEDALVGSKVKFEDCGTSFEGTITAVAPLCNEDNASLAINCNHDGETFEMYKALTDCEVEI